MTISEALGLRPGVTAVIGGGGKTTLLRMAGEELAASGHRVLLCTTTKILPFSGLSNVTDGDEGTLAAALALNSRPRENVLLWDPFCGSGTLAIDAAKVIEDVHLGDSIAVNGVCLTVTSFDKEHFEADVMPETVRRTSLAELRKGSPVNLERALTLASRLGGHIVSGHIDGVGTVTDLRREGNALLLKVAASPALLRGIVEKGSVALDGISLTVVAVTAADAKPFHSMASHRAKGAKQAITLIRSAEKVASFCNDVVGDICGIVSGSTAAVIVTQLQKSFGWRSIIVSTAVTAIISGVTIGGKAVGKRIAIKQSKKVVYFVAKLMAALHIG